MTRRNAYRKELPSLTRKLATMLASGMPLLTALGSLRRQTGRGSLKATLGRIIQDLDKGSTFAEALNAHPSLFDTMYVNVVAAGAAGGRLPESLERLADHLEASLSLRRKVRAAFIYPSLVISLAVLICAGLMIFALPKFTAVYNDADAPLPALTAALLGFSEAVTANLLEIIILAAGAVLLLKAAQATAGGRFWIDSLKMRLPLFGQLRRKIAANRFARTYGELIRSGVPALSALKISSGVSGNAVIERLLLQAGETLEAGHPLSEAFRNQPALPCELFEMLKAGEQSGRVDEMLEKLADMYDEEIRTTVSALLSILTPLIIVVLGVIVGVIVIAAYLPILHLPSIF